MYATQSARRPAWPTRFRSNRRPTPTLWSAPGLEVTDLTGTKEVLAIDGVAGGGWMGRDAAGMTWDCYVGQDAVDHEIISQDFLGEPILAPGRG